MMWLRLEVSGNTTKVEFERWLAAWVAGRERWCGAKGGVCEKV